MVADFEAGELEAMGRADDNDAVTRLDLAPFHQFEERSQGDAGVGTGVHASEIGHCCCVGKFVFASLLDNAIGHLDRLDSFVIADRVADLNGRGQGRLGLLHRLFGKAVAVALVEGISLLRLRGHQPRHLVDNPQIQQQFQAFVKGADVAQVADRDDNPVGRFPVKLAHNFNGNRFLALDANAVHGVRQIEALVLRHLSDDAHTAVKVGVERQDMGAIRHRLDQLRCADFALGQENNGRNTGSGSVGGEGGAGVAGTGAGDGAHGTAVGHHLFDHANQDGHAQVFEAAGVAVAAKLDPEIRHADLFTQSFGPEEVGVAFIHADDIFIAQGGHDPFAQSPDATAIRPAGGADAAVDQIFPFVGALLLQRRQFVVDFQ